MAFSALMNLYAPALETLVAMFTTDRVTRHGSVFSGGASSVLDGIKSILHPPQGTPVRCLKLSLQLNHTEFSQFILPMSSLTHISMSEYVPMGMNHPSIKLSSVILLDIHSWPLP
jgi:hypothetical protein